MRARQLVFVFLVIPFLLSVKCNDDDVRNSEWGKVIIKKFAKMGVDEVFFSRPDFLPRDRMDVYAGCILVRDASDSSMSRERMGPGIMFRRLYDVIEGVTHIEVRAFAPIDSVIDEEAQEVRISDHQASWELTEGALKRIANREQEGYFAMISISRPMTPYEDQALIKDALRGAHGIKYFIDVKYKREGNRLIFKLEDPRKHLFYSFEGMPGNSVFHFDKWYKGDGEVVRQTATFVGPSYHKE